MKKLNYLELRPFEPSDQEQCQALFSAGIMETLVPKFKNEMNGYLPFALILLSTILAVRWSIHDVLVLLGFYVIYVFLVYIFVYKALSDYIKQALDSDLKDIGKFYRDGSCMFVAVIHGQVVGIAGIQHKDNHKPGQAELFRMSVSSAFRKKGIGSKLLRLIIEFCQENQYSKITLKTSNEKVAAISLYRNHGFENVLTRTKFAHLPFNKQLHF